jgi:hypothetical protein
VIHPDKLKEFLNIAREQYYNENVELDTDEVNYFMNECNYYY